MKKVILAIYYVVALISLVFAGMYMFRHEFMSYHAQAVDMSWEEVPYNFQILIRALMIVSGGGWLAVFTGMALGIYEIQVNNDTKWYTFSPIIGMAGMIPTSVASLIVKFKTPGNPPYILGLVILALLLIMFFFSLFSFRKR